MKKTIRQGLVRNTQAAAIAAACIILLMVVAILRQINAASLDLNKSLVGLPRQTYDILVRPQSSSDPIEDKYGLVNPNHLNGINGGINFAQYEQIKAIKEVEVAAPIAMLGYFDQDYGTITILDKLPFGVYRVDIKNMLDNGVEDMGTQLVHPYYVFYAMYKLNFADYDAVTSVTQTGCSKGIQFRNDMSAGQHLGLTLVNPNRKVLIAAIDPEEEAKLVILDKTLTLGTYLSNENPTIPQSSLSTKTSIVPSLLNMRNYLDQKVHVTLTRLDVTYNQKDFVVDQMQLLPTSQELDSTPELETYQFSYDLSGINTALDTQFSVNENEVVSQRFYSSLLYGPSRQASPIRYREYEEELENWDGFTPVLEAIPEGTSSGQNIDLAEKYNAGSVLTCPGFEVWQVKPELNFRQELQSTYTYQLETQWVGQFEPERIIAGNASELNQVPLETYALPQAILRFDENGNELAQPAQVNPTFNDLGYLTTPPDVLISLESLKALMETNCVYHKPATSIGATSWIETDCPQKDNFISAIRVRVADITIMDEKAEEKVIALAKNITEMTGLQTDVMVGSSLQPVLVHLPGAGDLPGMGFVEENWIKKGVTTNYRTGFTLITALAALAMVAAGSMLILLMNYQALLSSQDEFLLLHILGWRKSTIFSRRLLPSMLTQLLVFLLLLSLLFTVPGLQEFTPTPKNLAILIVTVVLYSFVISYIPYSMIFKEEKERQSENER